MLDIWNNYSDILIPISYLLAGYIVGMLLQLVVMRRILSLTQKTRWKWDDVIANSFGQMPVIWCIIIGGFLAVWQTQVESAYYEIYYRTLITITLFTATLVLARVAGGIIERIPGERLPSTTLFVNGSRCLVYLLGLIIILQNLDIEITPMITALGIGGLAVALALEETLSNLFSGVQIIASQLVRPGDFVKLSEGHTGYVTDIKARSTTIRSFPDDNRIIVPNSVLSSSIVINYSLPEKNMWIEIPVGVAYDSDLEEVERITLEVANDVSSRIEGGVAEHKAVLRYEEFGDSSINFKVRLFVAAFRDQFTIKHEFIKALHKRYNQVAIEIPFPIRTVYMKNSDS